MVTADHKISDNGMRSLTITGEGRRIITDGMNNIDLVIRNDINTNPDTERRHREIGTTDYYISSSYNKKL